MSNDPSWLRYSLAFVTRITHNLFASGSLLLVYALSGTKLDKGGLRVTLVTVWFSPNAGLTVVFLLDGTLLPTLARVAIYLTVLGAGYMLGESCTIALTSGALGRFSSSKSPG